MKTLQLKEHLISEILNLRKNGSSLGLVPTMGALHDGHGSMIKSALLDNDTVIVSIFVNPTQFDNEEDLKKYPRTLKKDIEFLKNISERLIVYTPTVKDIYGGNAISEIFNFHGLDKEMEGKYRSGHFDGVGTIVKRLLNLIKPDTAYFGEKDFQQLAIIKQLVEQQNIPVIIVAHPIYREADGLAMSSRNVRLTPELRNVSPLIYETLQSVYEKFGTESVQSLETWVVSQFKSISNIKLEYFIIADEKNLKPIQEKSKNQPYRAFIAVYAGNVRLIDNIALN